MFVSFAHSDTVFPPWLGCAAFVHLQKYMPQEVAQAIARNKAKQEEEEARLQEGAGMAPAAVLFKEQASKHQWKPAGGRIKKDSVGRTPVESQTYEVTS